MNITIVQGHPDGLERHLCHALADAYAEGAREAGHAVRAVDLGTLDFPLLRTKREFEQEPIPPQLRGAQEDIAWANHLLFVYPLWLGEMPALLKAFLEQVLRPDFTFAMTATPRLRGKTARVVVTMGMPASVYRWYFRAHGLKSFCRNVLSFVGVKPIRTTLIGRVESSSPERRHRWLGKLRALGAAAG